MFRIPGAPTLLATKELNALFGLGIDLVANPDKRGDPFISAHSLFLGNKAGCWTGKKLGDYIKPGVKRRVVNGTDDAALIAGYADSFMKVLKAGAVVPDPGAVVEPVQPAPAPSPITTPATPGPEADPNLWAALVAIFISFQERLVPCSPLRQVSGSVGYRAVLRHPFLFRDRCRR